MTTTTATTRISCHRRRGVGHRSGPWFLDARVRTSASGKIRLWAKEPEVSESIASSRINQRFCRLYLPESIEATRICTARSKPPTSSLA